MSGVMMMGITGWVYIVPVLQVKGGGRVVGNYICRDSIYNK